MLPEPQRPTKTESSKIDSNKPKGTRYMKPLIPASIVTAALSMLGVASAQQPTPATAAATPSIAQAQAAAEKANAEIAQSEQEEKTSQELDKPRAVSRAGRN